MNNDNPNVPSGHFNMTPAEEADHERSVHDYPDISFSPSEYVVIDVQRSIWGLVRIWLIALLAFIAMILIFMIATGQLGFNGLAANSTDCAALGNCVTGQVNNHLLTVALAFITVVLPMSIGLVGSHVYRKNTFIVTNERIISHIQFSPFAHHTQNIEIENIEDCSYAQQNILQTALNFGTIRLSTVGDEQTYLFTFADNPKEQFKVINHVVQQVDEGEATKYRKK